MKREIKYFLEQFQGEKKGSLFSLPNWIKGLFTLDFKRFCRPDFVVWNEDNLRYLIRRWLLPRNPLTNAYLHNFRASDDDRALHDHRFFNISIVLWGKYIEYVPDRSQMNTPYTNIHNLPKIGKLRRPGSIIFRRPSSPHRLELLSDSCWTLFITGPVIRAWGFHCKQGWIHWKDFTAPDDKGRMGKGCEQ